MWWVLLNWENFFFLFFEATCGYITFNFSDLFLLSTFCWLFLYYSLCISSQNRHTADFEEPSTRIGGCKSAVLILDWQKRWQLSVKINLCSCSCSFWGQDQRSTCCCPTKPTHVDTCFFVEHTDFLCTSILFIILHVYVCVSVCVCMCALLW